VQRWEIVLQQQYEQDRTRLLDYREIDLEFKEWLIKLLYEEVTEKNERSEYSADDDIVHDDRICDRECVRTEQDQIIDPGPDCPVDEWVKIGAEEDRLAEMILTDPEESSEIAEEEDDDVYESFYEEIADYKCQMKAKPKKKHYKRK